MTSNNYYYHYAAFELASGHGASNGAELNEFIERSYMSRALYVHVPNGPHVYTDLKR